MITLVNGIDEILSYKVPPGEYRIFMNMLKNTFYVKSVDKDGQSIIGIYKFSQEGMINVQ